MRLPNLPASIVDYGSKKKSKGRTRTNYTKSLYDPAPRKRGRPFKTPPAPPSVPSVPPTPRVPPPPLVSLALTPKAPPTPKAPRAKKPYVPTGRPRGRPRKDPSVPAVPRVNKSGKTRVVRIPKWNDENSVINPLTQRRVGLFTPTYYKLIRTGALGKDKQVSYFSAGEFVRSKPALLKYLFPSASRSDRKALNKAYTYEELVALL